MSIESQTELFVLAIDHQYDGRNREDEESSSESSMSCSNLDEFVNEMVEDYCEIIEHDLASTNPASPIENILLSMKGGLNEEEFQEVSFFSGKIKLKPLLSNDWQDNVRSLQDHTFKQMQERITSLDSVYRSSSESSIDVTKLTLDKIDPIKSSFSKDSDGLTRLMKIVQLNSLENFNRELELQKMYKEQPWNYYNEDQNCIKKERANDLVPTKRSYSYISAYNKFD